MKPFNRSLTERRWVLIRQLNQLVFLVTALYLILDKIFEIDVSTYMYLAFFLWTVINWLLLRFNYLEASKVFGLLTFNMMIFVVATSEPFTTGMYLHFVTAGTVAMALYGYEQWKGALFFAMLSLTLHIITFTTDISFIPWKEVNAWEANLFFILNTLIMTGVCIYTIMIYFKFNYEAELALKEGEKVIREQNEELSKINIELDRFVYSASHDLRSPLSTLSGLISISKLEKDEELKSKYLDLMNDRIKSMNVFINEIIDYSRNSRVEVTPEKVNLKTLIESIVNDLHFQADKERIDFCWDMDDDLIVISDVSRIKIIFNNLISNAIKYHDPNKETSWIKLNGEKILDKIQITIEDNGIGIKSELQDRVFEMFYRAHEHSNGSGLGLYIVREALVKLGGSIAVESHEGKGSKFQVELPSEFQRAEIT